MEVDSLTQSCFGNVTVASRRKVFSAIFLIQKGYPVLVLRFPECQHSGIFARYQALAPSDDFQLPSPTKVTWTCSTTFSIFQFHYIVVTEYKAMSKDSKYKGSKVRGGQRIAISVERCLKFELFPLRPDSKDHF